MTFIEEAEEFRQFVERNPGIEPLVDQGCEIAASIFGDDKTHPLKANTLVAYGLVGNAYETFLEVFYLASRGFGRGAQARLRTMYENVASAAFLVKYPQQAERFISFQVVEQRKELIKAKDVLTRPGNEEFIRQLDAKVNSLDVKLAALKSKFGKCFANSWHAGIAAISDDLDWGHHFFYDYLIPNRNVHASPLLIERRMKEEKAEDKIYFESGPDYDGADEAIRGALTVLALSFRVAKDGGVSVDEKQLTGFITALLAHYKGQPNKTKL